MHGVAYVAVGAPARREAAHSISLLRAHGRYAGPVVVCGDAPLPLPGVHHILAVASDAGARSIKLALPDLVPADWASFCYLDADTRPTVDVSRGFAWLGDGWDLVITPSTQQGQTNWLWHASEDERAATIAACGHQPLQLQGGVWWVQLTARVRAFFAAWREEWTRWQGPDQGALLRALRRVPLRLWLLGRDWNGGALIEHAFGACLRR